MLRQNPRHNLVKILTLIRPKAFTNQAPLYKQFYVAAPGGKNLMFTKMHTLRQVFTDDESDLNDDDSDLD